MPADLACAVSFRILRWDLIPVQGLIKVSIIIGKEVTGPAVFNLRVSNMSSAVANGLLYVILQ